MEKEPAQVVAWVDALTWLKKEHPQWAEALEHRFLGLTYEETAREMVVSAKTIQRRRDRDS
jgi:DNA-directed RNA polymerase specialized sigma24 family protein